VEFTTLPSLAAANHFGGGRINWGGLNWGGAGQL